MPMALSNKPTSTSDNPSSKTLMVTKLSGLLAITQSFGQNMSQFVSEWAVCPISLLQDCIPSFPLTSPKPCISNHFLIPFSPPQTSFSNEQSPYRNNLMTSKPSTQKSILLIWKLQSDLNMPTNKPSKTITLNEVI
jgi:hypothetical protein